MRGEDSAPPQVGKPSCGGQVSGIDIIAGRGGSRVVGWRQLFEMKKSMGGWDSRYYTFGVGRGKWELTIVDFTKRTQVVVLRNQG